MKRVYFPNLNGLRFLAAFSVMIYHFFGEHVLNGHFGVTLFFTLSGFLITYLLSEEKALEKKVSIRKFYLRRILRIWPLYFLIVLIGSVFYLQENSMNEYGDIVPYYLFLAPNIAFVLHLGMSYSTILWSVGSEEQFYLIWPSLFRFLHLKSMIYLLFGIMFFWAFAPHAIDYINHNYFRGVQSLAILSKILGRMGFGAMSTGAVFAILYFEQHAILKFFYRKSTQYLAVLSILILWIGRLLPHVAMSDSIYALFFAVIILNLATNDNTVINLEFSILKYLGKISFGLYVFHLMAFDLTNYLLNLSGINLNRILVFILGICMTVGISSISYYLLERPFLKLKLKRFSVLRSGDTV